MSVSDDDTLNPEEKDAKAALLDSSEKDNAMGSDSGDSDTPMKPEKVKKLKKKLAKKSTSDSDVS